jgi:NADH:ubiquinone oxidoreductase subunit E
MTKNKTILKICLGSSCFSRGNAKVLERVKQYLNDHNLHGLTDFRGSLCSGNCDKGPVFLINDQIFYQVNENSIVKVLDDYFKDFEPCK